MKKKTLREELEEAMDRVQATSIRRQIDEFFNRYPKSYKVRLRMARILERGKANTLLGAYRKAIK